MSKGKDYFDGDLGAQSSSQVPRTRDAGDKDPHNIDKSRKIASLTSSQAINTLGEVLTEGDGSEG